MIGLPEDSLRSCLYSARETVKIGPSSARLYPTIVIEDTRLMDMYRQGIYTPLSLEDAVETTKEMYKILTDAGIKILRVGLKSSDLIQENGKIQGHTFHPRFPPAGRRRHFPGKNADAFDGRSAFTGLLRNSHLCQQ